MSKVKVIAWILAKLSHIFPRTFYVVMLETYPDGRAKRWEWHPNIVDRVLKNLL